MSRKSEAAAPRRPELAAIAVWSCKEANPIPKYAITFCYTRQEVAQAGDSPAFPLAQHVARAIHRTGEGCSTRQPTMCGGSVGTTTTTSPATVTSPQAAQ